MDYSGFDSLVKDTAKHGIEKECPIIFKDYTNISLINMFQHVKDINPQHSIRIYYSDTYHDVDLTKPHTYIKVYQDFIKVFSLNNVNFHEKEFVNPFNGDYCRLIPVNTIKSIEFLNLQCGYN